MLLALFLLSFLSAYVVNLQAFMKKADVDYSVLVGGAGGSGVKVLVNPYRSVATRTEEEPKKVAIQNVEASLLRVCAVLYFRLMSLGCSNYNDPAVLWGFLGAIGTTGSLQTVYTQPASSSLTSCSADNVARYGRFLLRRSIPRSYVTAHNLGYDLRGVCRSNADPCAYSEIVTTGG